MKVLGFLVSVIAAWAVRWLSFKLSDWFGASMTEAEQTDMANYISAATLVVIMGGVEFFERRVWPVIKKKTLDKWFPPVACLVLSCFLFSSCGTLGSVTLGVGLGNGLCAQVKVEWDDKTTTTETIKSDKADVTVEAAVDAIGVTVNKKPVKTTVVGYACETNADTAD